MESSHRTKELVSIYSCRRACRQQGLMASKTDEFTKFLVCRLALDLLLANDVNGEWNARVDSFLRSHLLSDSRRAVAGVAERHNGTARTHDRDLTPADDGHTLAPEHDSRDRHLAVPLHTLRGTSANDDVHTSAAEQDSRDPHLPLPAGRTHHLRQHPVHEVATPAEINPEWPDGNISYTISVPTDESKVSYLNTSWSMARFSTSSVRVKKSCLGVFVCPVDGCGFTVRPQLPKRRSKHCRPAPCPAACSVHNRPVSHIACRAILIIEKTSDNPHIITFIHQGYHRHRKPEAIRPSAQAMDELAHIIHTAPELTPKQLQMGTMTRPASGEIHHSLANIDRLRYIKTKLIKPPTSSLSEVLAFEKEIGEKLFVCIGSDALCLQTAFMQERARACESPMQSDSIEGILVDPILPDANVTMTTAYCPMLSRHVPLLISILTGKSAAHYRRHFLTLFSTMEMPVDVDAWEHQFPGNTSDFSDAERAGFEAALRAHCHLDDNAVLALDHFYRYCDVHFKRTLSRVSRNAGVIHPDDKALFYETVLSLTIVVDPIDFANRLQFLYQRFPKARRWLDWHLHELRGRHIFPALATGDISLLPNNTNAQESVGGSLKRCCNGKQSIVTVIPPIYLFVKQIAQAYTNACLGIQERYNPSRSRSTKKTRSDGRPPDTTKDLLRKRSERQKESVHRSASVNAIKKLRGRPPGSTNTIPKLGSLVDWKTFGIPWGFTSNGVRFTNTCPMDTGLMTLYLLFEYGRLRLPSGDNDSPVLGQVMDLISQERYNEARLLWLAGNHVPTIPKSNIVDLFGTVEDIVHRFVPNFFFFTVVQKSDCTSEHCPERSNRVEMRRPGFEVIPGDLDVDDSSMTVQQSMVDSLIGDRVTRCTQSVDEAFRLSKPDSAFRVLDDNQGGAYMCSGVRTLSRWKFVSGPPLILEFEYVPRACIAKPSCTITLNGTTFRLAAVIFGSGGHFTSIIYIGGACLFYDGMSKTKLVWLKTRPEKEKFRHSKVCRVWYQPDQTVPPSSPIPSRRDEGADLLLSTIVPKGPRSPPAEKVMSPVEALDDPPPVHHDALSRHSLPWGFRYGAFDAVNTCAVDTGLMTVFILHKYWGLHIPASHPQLLEAVTLIGQGSHEEARFLWATRCLGYPSTGHHDMWNNFGDNFSNVVPDLFRMVIADRLLCSNSSCHNRVTLRTRECALLDFDSRNIMQLSSSAVTQAMVDAYLGRDFDSQNGFLTCSAIDMTCVDPQESHAAACSGSLSLQSYVIQHYPPLVEIILHSDLPQRSAAWNTPQPVTLTFGAWQYDLAAMVVRNCRRNHFASLVLLRGEFVYYDGMMSPCVRKADSTTLNGHVLGRLWYLKTDRPARNADTSSEQTPRPATRVVPPDSTRNDPPTPSETLPSVFPTMSDQGRSPGTSDQRSEQRGQQRRKRYPLGMSVQQVSVRGPKPLCQTCGNAIERDQRRLVIVTRNELRQWNKQLSYHLADECLTTGLTAAQKVELTTLLEADDILRTQLAGTGYLGMTLWVTVDGPMTVQA